MADKECDQRGPVLEMGIGSFPFCLPISQAPLSNLICSSFSWTVYLFSYVFKRAFNIYSFYIS